MIWQTLGLCLVLSLGLMLGLWIISLLRRDASVVDPFWGVGFIVLAWTSLVWNRPSDSRILLMCVLITVWGLRLSLYLLWRNHGAGEDSRYAAMRAHHGANFWWVSLFTVFLLQGVLLWFISMPIQATAAITSREEWTGLDLAGIVLWTVGFLFESIGDFQLARFKSQPANAGKVMDRGLWRYTRHPNYFGDFCVWWGIYLIAVAGGAAWTIASPALMSFLLIRVSGVRLLESTITDRRPNYQDYQRRTSPFLPWPPQHNSSRISK